MNNSLQLCYLEYISGQKKVTSLKNTVNFIAKLVSFILYFLLVYGIYTKQSFSNLRFISCTFPKKDKKCRLMEAMLSPTDHTRPAGAHGGTFCDYNEFLIGPTCSGDLDAYCIIWKPE